MSDPFVLRVLEHIYNSHYGKGVSAIVLSSGKVNIAKNPIAVLWGCSYVWAVHSLMLENKEVQFFFSKIIRKISFLLYGSKILRGTVINGRPVSLHVSVTRQQPVGIGLS